MPATPMFVDVTPGGCIVTKDILKKEVNYYPMSQCHFRFMGVVNDVPASAILYYNNEIIARFPSDPNDEYHGTMYIGMAHLDDIISAVDSSPDFGQIKTY